MFAFVLKQFYNDQDWQDPYSSQNMVECHLWLSTDSDALARLEISDAQEKQFTVKSTETR